MKIIYFLIFCMFIVIPAAAQKKEPARSKEWHEKGPHKRLEELEKIKLIEVLDMDEETTLKFFSRQNANRDKLMELNKQLMDKTDQLEKLVKDDADDQKIKNAVKEYLDLENKIHKEKTEFVNSVSDILTEEQIAKMIVFEKKFKEEIRNILIRERGKFRQMD